MCVRLESMSELTKGKDHPAVQEFCDTKVIMVAKQFYFYFFHHSAIADLCWDMLRLVFCLHKDAGTTQDKTAA